MTRLLAEKVRRLHKQRGFLLLEAIMAVTVITLGTIAIMRTYSNSLSAGVLSQQFLTASNLAEQIIWETVSAPALDALTGGAEGRFEPPNDLYSWKRTVKAVFPEFGETGEIDDLTGSGAAGDTGATVPEGDTEADEEDEVYILYEIEVAVSWQYRRQTRELKYQTAVMRKQPDPETEEFEETGTQTPPQTGTNEFRQRESEKSDDTGTNRFNSPDRRRFRETDRE